MKIGELIVEQGLASERDIERALEHQETYGGRLGDNLVELGIVTQEQLADLFEYTPAPPRTIEDTGLSEGFLTDLVLKVLYQTDTNSTRSIASLLRLPLTLVGDLMKGLVRRQLVEVAGESRRSTIPDSRYNLTANGRAAAAEALNRSGYVGPAPVPLDIYQRKVIQQRISSETVTAEDLHRAFSHLVIPDDLLAQLGPGVNSAAALLMYGPPGNGKTAIAEAVSSVFRQTIFVPHAVEVDGQVIKLFDPTVHTPIEDDTGRATSSQNLLRADRPDERWVACRRPLLVAGGELTLEMLDMKFEPLAKYYEAPLQLKATNGIFVIDDFGRQRVEPEQILNRWIVPLERRVDYLTLHTGRKFPVEFDELVVFSTNYPPKQMMDAAMLRRIPYKIEIGAPSRDDFKEIFRRIGGHYGIEIDDAVLEKLIREYYEAQEIGFASYHPKFLLDQVAALCKFRDVPLQLTDELLWAAVGNLSTSY